MSLVRRAGVLLAFTVLALPVRAQEPLRKDGHGDALPPGAVARLGKRAFRVAAPVEAVRYLDGGRTTLVKTSDPDYRIDGSFQLFDARSGKELNRLTSRRSAELDSLRHEDFERYYTFPEWCLSPDGKWLARVDPVATKDTTRVQWQEVATGKVVARIEVGGCHFHHPRFSPDGKYLAVIAAREPYHPKLGKDVPAVIRMWDVATRREVRTFAAPPKQTFWPRGFAFSPDGAYLAASGFGGGKRGVVRVWAVAGEKPSWALEGQRDERDSPTPFAFSPDGKAVAALHDRKLGLWDAGTGKPLQVMADYDGRCATLEFSPDRGRLLACKPHDINGRGPEQIQMWDCRTGKRFDLPVDQPGGFVFSRAGDTLVVFDQSRGSLLICDGATGQVKHAIRVETLRPDRSWQGLGWPFALSPDGTTLVFADRAGPLRRFAVATGKELPAPGPASEVADALAFSPDGKKLLAAGKTQILLHELDGSRPPLPLTVKPVADARVREFHQIPRVQIENRYWPNANCVALSGDGARAAAGWINGLVSVWDTASGKLLWQARVIDLPIHCVTFAAGDRTVISSGLNGQVVWWDADTGRVRHKLERVPGKTFGNHESLPFRFGPGGQTAFGRSPDSEALEEWELASGQVRRTLDVRPYPVDFSHDGRSVLVIGENAYHSIDRISGRPLRSFSWAKYPQPESNPYGWCRFSPDGRTVAGLVNYKILRFWDADTATVLAEGSDPAGFTALAFAPDGSTVATACGDGTILLWRTTSRPAAPARKPPADPPVAGQADGAALPAGARARLGRPRFQQGDTVRAVRYVAGGRSILATTASDDSPWDHYIGLALWDSAAGTLQWRTHVLHVAALGPGGLHGPPPEGWCVSPNGELLATVNLPGRKGGETVYSPLVVRELATGKALVRIEGEFFRRFSADFLQFSPDSKTLVTLGERVKLYDLSTGQVRRVVPIEEKEFLVTSARFTPDGQLLVLVGYAAKAWEIRWWHLGRGGAVRALPHRPLTEEKRWYPEPGLGSFVLAPDSRHLALVTRLRQGQTPHLVLVEIESGKVVRDFGEQAVPPRRLLFSPDGKQLASLGSDRLERWEVSAGKRLPPVSAGETAAVQFSPDGKTLAVADGSALRLYEAATGAERRRIPCQTSAIRDGAHAEGDLIAFSPDGKQLAAAQGRTIRQWDVATGREIGPTPYAETVHAVAVARDARWVAACSSRHVRLWDAAGRVVLRVAAWPDAGKRQAALTAVALSADGRRLAVGGSDGAVALFHVPTGKRLSQLRFHGSPVTSLAFAAGGRKLLSADLKNRAALWDAVTGEQIRKYALPPREDNGTPRWMKTGPEAWHELLESRSFFHPRSFCPVLTADGGRLLTPSSKAVTVWELDESPPRKTTIPRPHEGKFTVTGDGRFLVSGPNWDESYYINRDSALHWIDTASGQTVRVFANFPRVRDFSLSPDGKLLAACGTEGLCLWDTATGTRRATFGGHRGTVTAVAFSPDGGALISAAQDGTLLIWDVARLVAKPAPEALTDADRESLWVDLTAADARVAGKAMRRLAGHPQQAAALLGQKLKPAAAPRGLLAKRVADLDDARAKVREAATRQLKELAEMAEPALRACLAAGPTLEQRRRIELILAGLDAPITDPGKLRALRAVELLAVIGTPEAVALLRRLASGADGAYETREARAALRWMGK